MKKVVIRSMPAIVGLIAIMVIGSFLSNSTYHTKLTQYGLPICSLDRHRFEESVCSECGAKVEDTGVFFSSEVARLDAYNGSADLRFTDYYENYEAFQLDYASCLSYSQVIMAILVLEIFTYVLLLIMSKRKLKVGDIGGRLQ